MMMFLILEQLTDTPATVETSRKWAAEFVDAIQNVDAPKVTKEGPAAILQHLGSKVIAAIDPPYRAGYIASNLLLAEGVVQEAIDREDGALQTSLTSYIQTRRKSIGALPFHYLDLWIWQLEIPEPVSNHPHIQTMVDAAVDLVGLGNDIYSYRKEYLEDGAKHNFVTVAMNDPSTGIQAGDIPTAMNFAVDQFKTTLARVEQLKNSLPSFDEHPGLGPTLDRYVELMMDSVTGNIEWSVACKRYSLFEDVETRKKGYVTIPS
ncbi:hypothetical protein MIND_00726200 [Mycena indigotica]|uniref:Terpene synthase n=1 Tax=Mycena indigotica TaxID=2126181 RepID=A0A8H6W1J0_9AGAR|nr:uncharacterized protein MIND_00726200 [Mycena indigotica]KAF7301607.1 hypothetical protein MIND_00726200 [Mycena indigotica]